MRARWLVVAMVGCADPRPEPEGDDTYDTGWFDSAPSGCGGEVLGSEPEDGRAGWIVHDPLVVTLERPEGLDDATARLTTGEGVEVPVEVRQEREAARLVVEPQAPLAPSTSYELSVQTCRGGTVLGFVTSDLGGALQVSERDLVGRTWTLELADAEWLAPAGLAPLFRANVDGVFLLGISWVQGDRIDLIGTQGLVSGGQIQQDARLATWDLPTADFSLSPRLRTGADRVVLDIQGVPLPIEGFAFEATLSPDGERLGDGRLRGRLDVRGAGELLGRGGSSEAVCELAAASGLPCVACEDGEVGCLDADLRRVEGERVPGLRLVPVTQDR